MRAIDHASVNNYANCLAALNLLERKTRICSYLDANVLPLHRPSNARNRPRERQQLRELFLRADTARRRRSGSGALGDPLTLLRSSPGDCDAGQVCVCIYIFVNIYIYTYIHTYKHINICIYVTQQEPRTGRSTHTPT